MKREYSSDLRRYYVTIERSFGALFITLFLSLNSAFAEEERLEEPIVVNGDRVEYLYEEKKVVGINNVVITYKDVILTCDNIVVDMDTKEAIAEGDVVMTQDEGVFKGEKVHYNFETEKGTIIKAEARSAPWYGKGDIAAKTEEKRYAIDRGYLTSCDLPQPHYRMQARKVKIYIDDRVEAYHILFFAGKVPIFYFPYYVHPLKDKRPRVTMVPGRNDVWGAFLLTAWRYYLHEWSRGYIHFDYREKKGFGEGFDYKYKLGYFGKGIARFYYTDEKHAITPEEEETQKTVEDDRRWRFQLRHKWQIDEDTTFLSEYHKLSDPLFIKDYFFLEEYVEDRQPETYVSIIRAKPNYSLSLYTTARVNGFFEAIEKLPELKMDLYNQRLRDTDFYYRATTSYVLLQRKFEKGDSSPKQRVNRLDTDHELSYLTKLFHFLTFRPYAGIRETWYSEDLLENKNQLRNIFTLGTELYTKFHRIFHFKTKEMGLDINDIKHTITPSANYTYVPVPNIKSVDLKQFDGIDRLGLQNAVALELLNTLQTKRGEDKKPWNLARFSTSTSIYLHPTINGKKDDRTLDDFIGDVSVDLILTPYPGMSFHTDAIYNTGRNREDGIQTVGLDLVAGEEDPLKLGFGYRFEQGYDANGRIDDSANRGQFISEITYKIGSKWRLRAYHRYKKDADRDNFELEEQNYAIERDLHCWLVELNYQMVKSEAIDVEADHRVWLVMRLKAFPEIPFKMFSTHYSAPRAGVDRVRDY